MEGVEEKFARLAELASGPGNEETARQVFMLLGEIMAETVREQRERHAELVKELGEIVSQLESANHTLDLILQDMPAR